MGAGGSAELSDLYPRGPADVPPDLTQVSRAYSRGTWIALLALVCFVGLYAGLVWWFGHTAFELGREAWVSGSFGGFFLAIPPAIILLFLVKGFFRIKRQGDPLALEITAQQEPLLLAFVHRLAGEVGAPRPHRVFVSPRVNAAVFYDLSIVNLLFPSKKNLEIGLGLVNALSLDEFKAVLGHEFGHFAQRSMAVGPYVYIANQVVGHLVAVRDGFDRFLLAISSTDPRIAWIGWLLRLVVWSVRAVLDTAFRAVLLLQAALSREMELQADLVAVSVTGSDSLIHALHRLQSADESWDGALDFLTSELAAGRGVTDLFAVHRRFEERLAQIRGEPVEAPALPSEGRERHRVFPLEVAHPPKMWSSHPPNHEREENAKRRYLPSPLDPRSPWSLFADAEATRREMTLHVAKLITHDEVPDAPPMYETLRRVEEPFERSFLAPRYRGLYFGRSAVLGVASARELYEADGELSKADIEARLRALYPERLADDLSSWRELSEKHAALEALHDGVLDAPGGVIRFEGREVKRKQLPGLIQKLRKARDDADLRLRSHDREVRSVHRWAAARLGGGWEAYLLGLAGTLHYAEHLLAELRDAHDYLHHVVSIVLADGNVTKKELRRVLKATSDPWLALNQIYAHRESIELSAPVLQGLEAESWSAVLPPTFDLGAATEDALGGGWIEALDSWASPVSAGLIRLRRASLECLIDAELRVASAFLRGEALPAAPSPARLPSTYLTRCTGTERERQKTLGWWDRFQLADGFWAGTARLCVASAVLVPTIFLGGQAVEREVLIHNGLAVPLRVQLGDRTWDVYAGSETKARVGGQERVLVRTTTRQGTEVERFDASLSGAWKDRVYNIASGSRLVERTVVYGNLPKVSPRDLGVARWVEVDADYYFRDPPREVSTRDDRGATKRVLDDLDDRPPGAQTEGLTPELARVMIGNHLRWDSSSSRNFLEWCDLSRGDQELETTLARRIQESPADVVLRRFEMDTASEDARRALCVQHTERARANPDSADAAYLAARCLDAGQRPDAYLAGYERFPDHGWLAAAAAGSLADRLEFSKAEQAMGVAVSRLPAVRHHLVFEQARLRRIAAGRVEVDLSDLDRVEPMARILSQIDLPDPHGSLRAAPLEPYALMAQGKLKEAFAKAMADQELIRLIAASEGAWPEVQELVLGFEPKRGLSQATILSAWSLAKRHGRDTAAMEARLTELHPEGAAVLLRVLQSMGAGARDIELRMREVRGLAWRGQLYAAGCVLRGDKAPKEWRERARLYLFATERPYLGSEP